MPNGSRVTQTYTEDPRGVQAILTSPAMKAALLAVVEQGKKHAESIAPRRSGHYASKFVTNVEERTDTGGKYPGTKRAEASLDNTADYAASVEFGTQAGPDHAATRPQRVLGRTQEALRAAGRAAR